jgi:hypothetical protein
MYMLLEQFDVGFEPYCDCGNPRTHDLEREYPKERVDNEDLESENDIFIDKAHNTIMDLDRFGGISATIFSLTALL